VPNPIRVLLRALAAAVLTGMVSGGVVGSFIVPVLVTWFGTFYGLAAAAVAAVIAAPLAAIGSLWVRGPWSARLLNAAASFAGGAFAMLVSGIAAETVWAVPAFGGYCALAGALTGRWVVLGRAPRPQAQPVAI
jgi:hypothetical protein